MDGGVWIRSLLGRSIEFRSLGFYTKRVGMVLFSQGMGSREMTI
jgi:hypothetical protein